MTQPETIGAYRGELDESVDRALIDDLPARLAQATEVLAAGRNRVVRVGEDVVVKVFGRQPSWKDRVDREQGTKAFRSWRAAKHLEAHGVGTPEPLGYLERWDGSRLIESYLLTRWMPDTTDLRRELIRIYRHEPVCARLMDLLQAVADGTRAMHDAGVIHRDLGNQNILLASTDEGWRASFLDLNRARMGEDLDESARARDLARLYLPSDLLRVFFEMYWNARPSEAFQRVQNRERHRYALHARTRKWRHPIRTLRNRDVEDPELTYPPEKEIWIWDDRSAQAISVLGRKDRNRLRSKRSGLTAGRATLAELPGVRKRYRERLQEAYRAPVEMAGRIGMSIEPAPGREDREVEALQGLGRIPVLLRFYHHQGPADWARTARLAQRLHGDGHAVSIALTQDRKAVTNPASWARFAGTVLDSVQDCVEWVELGHAINRVKWGVWSWAEYRRMMEPIRELMERHPAVKWMGPAGIDFEYPHVLGALSAFPPGMRFAALSHHLYVDRRGAPENEQGGFDTLGKAALACAIADRSDRCDGRLIISEVNWPLAGTGVYSPVTSPYDTPGPRYNDPSVSEDAYARYMIRYLLITLCSGQAERVYWWRLVARGFGLIDDTEPDAWRERPAYIALQAMLEAIGEARFLRKADADPDVHYFWFEAAGGVRCVLGYSVSGSAPWSHPFSCAGARPLVPADEELAAWPEDGGVVLFDGVGEG